MNALSAVTQVSKFLVGALALGITVSGELVLGADGAVGGERSLTINVSHRDNSGPLGGIQITVRLGSKPESASTAETDANGRCTVRWSQEWKGPVLARAEKTGFAPLQMVWQGVSDDDAAPDQFTFTIPPAETVGGRVLDQAGQPVVGAHVMLNFPQRLTGARVPVDDFVIETDPEGRWKADFVPAGVTSLRVTATHPNCIAPANSKEVPPSLAGLRDLTSVIRLDRVLQLTGRVTSPEGKPVAAANVVRGSEYGIMGLGTNEENSSTQTDARGEFRFERLKAGKIMVAAQAPGFGPAIATAEVRAEGSPIELKLQTPHVLRGKVTDLSGAPLEGVRLRADDWARFRYPGWDARTDLAGQFVFSNMPPGSVSFDISKSGYMGRMMYRLTVGEAEPILKLGPVLRLHGRVLDAGTGEPVTQFTVTPGWPRQTVRQGNLTWDGGEWATYQTKPFTKGTYDLTFDRPIVAGTVELYDFLLQVEAEGYDPAVSRRFKADEADATFDFQLKKGVGVKGLVKLPDGTPVAGAKVHAYTGFNWPYTKNGRVVSRSRAKEYTTGPDGVFKMAKPTEPMNLLVLHELGEVELESTALENAEEIVLKPWAKIQGVLRVGNQTGARQKLALRFRSRYELRDGSLRQVMSALRDFEVTSDDKGRFAFDQVPPGDVSIVRVIDIPRPGGMGTSMDDVWGGCPMATLRLNPGETANLAIGGDGRRVAGRLSLPAGVDMSSGWGNGQFTLKLAGPRISTPPDMSLERLPTWLSEWVWSEAGANWRRWLGGEPQVMDYGLMPSQTANWYVKIEPDGRFQIEDLPPGEYQFVGNVHGAPVSRGNYEQLGRVVATLMHSFIVPPLTTGQESPPFDLGTIQLKAAPDAPNLPPGFNPALLSFPRSSTPSKATIAPVVALNLSAPDFKRLLTAGVVVHPPKVKPGESCTVFVKARIFPGSSIEGLEAPDGQTTTTSLDLQLPARIHADGSWQASQPSAPNGGIRAHFHEVVFTRSLKVADDAPAGSVKIQCGLRYQISHPLLAFPQSTIHLETALDVVVSP